MKKLVFIAILIALFFSLITSIAYADTVEVDSRVQELQQKIDELQDKEDTLSKQINILDSNIDLTSLRINSIEAAIDKLQMAILEKVGSYGRGLESIKKEMTMMQDSFSKVLPSAVKHHAHPAHHTPVSPTKKITKKSVKKSAVKNKTAAKKPVSKTRKKKDDSLVIKICLQ